MRYVGLIQQQLYQIEFGEYFWALIGLGIPFCAALGNVTRSLFWPAGTSALAFSCATISTSACFLFVLTLVCEPLSADVLAAPTVVGSLFLLICVSAISYLMNFKLQKVGGSVFFSQLGYWGTGYGVLLTALLFDDVLSVKSLLALAAIIVGGVLVKGKPAPKPVAVSRTTSG
ncbi:hypothetical protein [Breoghania sp.]|uniref:hypothetical protein n=1 Tax=Breoghania sp. TaxID=2065378 RepID=UPI002605AE89|nr:hypothetical protein [Breoghania sp.]MDJ0931264.1 hypothetical protein [Breoghania sp.]